MEGVINKMKYIIFYNKIEILYIYIYIINENENEKRYV